VSATMGSRMVAVGTMPTKDDDIVPMMVTRSTMTHCGRADNDDNRPLMSDDRPDVLSHTHTRTIQKTSNAASNHVDVRPASQRRAVSPAAVFSAAADCR